MSEKYLELIGKLLRQAEAAGTEDEAATFMAKAQALAVTNAIDLERARQHVADKSKRQVPTHRRIVIGERGKKLLFTYVELFHQIAQANDIKINIAHNSTSVNAFGFDSDIAMCEALYASLVIQMVRACDEYLRSGEYKQEKVWRSGRYKATGERRYSSWEGRYVRDREWVDGDYVSVSSITARKSFQEAFAIKVGTRLRLARNQAIQAAEEARQDALSEAVLTAEAAMTDLSPESTSTELVLRAKEVEVADYYKQHSRARGSYRGGRSSTGRSDHASAAGRTAGASARLGGERAIGGSRPGLTS
jgi:hypothetical protein